MFRESRWIWWRSSKRSRLSLCRSCRGQRRSPMTAGYIARPMEITKVARLSPRANVWLRQAPTYWIQFRRAPFLALCPRTFSSCQRECATSCRSRGRRKAPGSGRGPVLVCCACGPTPALAFLPTINGFAVIAETPFSLVFYGSPQPWDPCPRFRLAGEPSQIKVPGRGIREPISAWFLPEFRRT